MIIPSAYGPRSLTVHVAVAPFDALIVTTVPIGSVRCAHVPGGAASYQVAPPLWLRPDGAGALDPDPDDPDFGAGFAGAAVGLDAGFTVVVVCRATGFGGAVDVVARTRSASGTYLAGARVVEGAVASVVAGAAVWSSAGGGSAAEAETVSAPPRTWGGDEDGGAPACIRASAGPPAMAAHKATGTARRDLLSARVVRTPPLLENAGAACPPTC